MKVDNENIEPETELVLAPGYPNQCVQRRLDDDSGAGANAGSRIDVAFVANDVLSELVWSPHKGSSLKCAECSFTKEKSSRLQCSRADTYKSEKPTDREGFTKLTATNNVESEVAGVDTFGRAPSSDTDILPVYGSTCDHGKGQANEEMADALEAGFAQIKQLPGDPSDRNRDVGSAQRTLGLEIVLASVANPENENQAADMPVPSLMPPCRRDERYGSFTKEGSENEMKRTGSFSNVPPLEKLESSAENDSRALISENVCDAPGKIVALESAREAKNSSQHDEVSVKYYPTASRIHMHRRKGKRKASSAGDINGIMSKEEDDSHESVESCNSAQLFSTGKTQWGSEHQLIVGNKRVEMKISESPGCSSFARHDSSFMSWISNMMKGFVKPNQDEPPSLALTLAHPNQHESPGQKLITCSRNQDAGCRSIGFQSIFQSLYCPDMKVEKPRPLDANNQTGQGSEEIEMANNICDVTAIADHGKDDDLGKQCLLSKEKCSHTISGNGTGPGTHPQFPSENFVAIQDNCTNNCVDNKHSCNSETKGKDLVSSDSSLGKRKTRSAKNFDTDLPSDVKRTHKLGNTSNPLGSSWITRFCPKSSGLSSSLDQLNQNKVGVSHSSDCMKLVPPENHVGVLYDDKILDGSTEGPVTVVDNELQHHDVNAEPSIRFNVTKGRSDQKSICKLNPVVPFQRFKSSEALASIFARRLDVLKHIIPSDVKDIAASAVTRLTTCFFCGVKGHQLRDCPEITETEVDDLLRNISSSDRAEGSSCLCIRCFQLSHWAHECPSGPRKRHQTDAGTSLINGNSPSKLQPGAGNEKCPKLLDCKDGQCQAATSTICVRNEFTKEAENSSKKKPNEIIISDKLISNSDSSKIYNASSSGKNKLKENWIPPICNLVNKQMWVVPKELFDTIRRLHLSRTDILKWMNSHTSLSHLDGFFLRLRLVRWEEGLGGTGYYVACITGTQRESISVNLGGMKCIVERKYISNHDFLEDELLAWYAAISRNGGKIPSEVDLKAKIEQRKMLGF